MPADEWTWWWEYTLIRAYCLFDWNLAVIEQNPAQSIWRGNTVLNILGDQEPDYLPLYISEDQATRLSYGLRVSSLAHDGWSLLFSICVNTSSYFRNPNRTRLKCHLVNSRTINGVTPQAASEQALSALMLRDRSVVRYTVQ